MLPPAEIDATPALVSALLADQHPDLADRPVTAAGSGWDNALFRLGPDLVVRLPRHANGGALVVHEQAWLPVLAGRLPLDVPVPVRRGVPSAAFPWAWSVCPWFEGTPGDRVGDVDARSTAQSLGTFLAALHAPAPPDAPRNPMRSPERLADEAVFEERCARVAERVDTELARAVWSAGCRAAPAGGPPGWIHGDLHPANIVFADGVPRAVVDFGDVCAGDPATDLSCAWTLLPADAVPTFFDAYGGADDALVARARAWAAWLALVLLGIGRTDRPSYEAVGRATLDRLAASAR